MHILIHELSTILPKVLPNVPHVCNVDRCW